MDFIPPVGRELTEMDVYEGVEYVDDCVVVEGVVSPSGGCIWCGRRETYEVHMFSLAGWRLADTPLVDKELNMLRAIPPSGPARDKVFTDFPAYSIQRFNVFLSKDRSRAVVEEVLQIGAPDVLLLRFSEQARKPVVVGTKQFGKLVLDPKSGWFDGKARWRWRKVEVHFEKGEDGSLDGALATAEVLWSDQAGWKRRVDAIAVEELLPVKNDSWLEEGEVPLTPKAFKSKMTLTSINLRPDGNFAFWYDDGDLFLGHWIEVRGNLKDGPTDAGIHG